MRRNGIGVWGILVLMLWAGRAAFAQTKPLNTLTEKEIAGGWIQLFDGETLFGWHPRGDSNWVVMDGMIQATDSSKSMLCTNTEFADYELRIEVWLDKEANSGIMLRAPLEGEISPMNSYEVNVYDAHPQWPTGSIHTLQRTRSRIKAVDQWSAFVIRAVGDRLTVTVNGKKTVDVKDSKFKRGQIALQHFGGIVRFRNIFLKPLSLKPLFNGKDLSGWTVLPGRASVYSVTPEGWLNVKNGGGEIQTTSVWGDFVLQLDIISNGTHLNSGVFFREEPGGFWQGYESQIRNQWQGEDRTKPVDFGTGGIYNRQPARKVVSRDREWFTKTVIAAGKHIAVWVNGYLVSDWTDTRPEKDNARQGARTRAGSIGLQGHDPTTDLSFRNIQIMEYPSGR